MKDYVRRADYFCWNCEQFRDSTKYVCGKCYKAICEDCAGEHDCEQREE